MTATASSDSRRQRGEATRERLLDAATAAFAAKGLYGTSLRDIGGPLGLANASLLHHFSGKSALYAEVLIRIEEMLGDMAREIEADGGTVETIFDGIWDWIFGHPSEARIVIREMMDNSDRVDTIERWFFAGPMHRLVKLIARGQRAGRYRACNPVVYLFHVIGSISYVAPGLPTISGIAGEPPDQFKAAYRKETREHILRAIRPESPEQDV